MLAVVLSNRRINHVERRPKENNNMNFDQWIDSVNEQVHARLGSQVRTEELSWDSAHWVSAAGNVVATLQDNETAAKIAFDNGEHLTVQFNNADGAPDRVGETIAQRLR
jgi:hypothetical protein